MELEKAKEFIKNSWLFNTVNENIRLKEAIAIILQELDCLQKENEELKAKQVMQEYKIDWCEKNTIKKCNIKAIFSTYESRREQGKPVIGYHTLKEFVKKILEEK